MNMNKIRCRVAHAGTVSVGFWRTLSSYSKMLEIEELGRVNSIVDATPSKINPLPSGKSATVLNISPINFKSFGALNKEKDERQMIAKPHAERSAMWPINGLGKADIREREVRSCCRI